MERGTAPATTVIESHLGGVGEPAGRIEPTNSESDIDEDIIVDTSPQADPMGGGKFGRENSELDAPPAREAQLTLVPEAAARAAVPW